MSGQRQSGRGIGLGTAAMALVVGTSLLLRRARLDANAPRPPDSAQDGRRNLPPPRAESPEPTGTPDTGFAQRLDIARVELLRRGLHPLNIVSTVACLIMAGIWAMAGALTEIGPWVAFGGLALVLRLALLRVNPARAPGGVQPARAREFLRVSTLASVAVGLMLAWGWVVMLANPSGLGVEILLMAHVAVLLVSLCAGGSHLPGLLALLLASSVPVMLALGMEPGASDQKLVLLLGLGLLSLASAAFSVRFSRDFRDTFALRDRVQRLLEEVSVKRDEAVLANQAKSRFLASVSHDLRQPMHAMNLYLASVAGHFDRLAPAPGHGASAGSVRDGIRSLQDSMLYLNGMFESLLDISRLNSGSVPVEIRHTTLHRMLGQLEADYSRQAASQGLRFELRLPPQVHLMEVETDPALLERLLRNLLVNAIRYTRSGGVRLSVVAKGRSLDFRVVDTGLGIERAMRKRVFEEFFRVPGAQAPARASEASRRRASRETQAASPESGQGSTGRGIGLGLSISARLADKLGAPIRLHSCVGLGSVFAIRQPMRIALRPRRDTLPEPARADPTRLPPGLFVAVIDDDIEIRRSTRQMLEVLGIEVFTSDSAAQAAQQLGRAGRRPDLLLSDYRLGSENGVEAIALLREEFNHDIPAILVTGDTSPERIEEFRLTGLRVLYKPVSGASLLAAVEEELRAVSPAAP